MKKILTKLLSRLSKTYVKTSKFSSKIFGVFLKTGWGVPVEISSDSLFTPWDFWGTPWGFLRGLPSQFSEIPQKFLKRILRFLHRFLIVTIEVLLRFFSYFSQLPGISDMESPKIGKLAGTSRGFIRWLSIRVSLYLKKNACIKIIDLLGRRI